MRKLLLPLCLVIACALVSMPVLAQQDDDVQAQPAPKANAPADSDDPPPDSPDGKADPDTPVESPEAPAPAPTPEEIEAAEQARNKAIADKFAPESAADVENAPPPGEADGVARAEPSGARHLLWIPRVVFFVPRVALEVVSSPVRGFLYVFERYQLAARAKEIFFNDTGTAGLFPTFGFQSGFGINAGASAVHKDLFGLGIKAKVKGSFGGRFNQAYAASFGTGDSIDNVEIALEGLFEARPKDFFYGIGNGDVIDSPMVPIDPLVPGAPNVRSRFRQDSGRIALVGKFQLPANFSLNLTSALLIRDFDNSDEGGMDQDIFTNFETDQLTGFDNLLKTTYNELELRYDTRRAVSRYESAATPGGGWLAGSYIGYAKGTGDDPSNYFRYGVDIQHFFRLARGPRTFALRAFFEGVTGDYDEVPFVDLPRLGGAVLLRGYDTDRFRDRALALFSAEYQWDLSQTLGAALFVDTGRVFGSFDDFDFEDYRLGYGFALQKHSMESFIFRLGLASTIDRSDERNILITFSFDPIYDPKARTERQ